MAKALTAIKHEGKVIPEGTTVKKGDFKDDEWKALLENDAVSEDDNTEPQPTPQKTSDIVEESKNGEGSTETEVENQGPEGDQENQGDTPPPGEGFGNGGQE